MCLFCGSPLPGGKIHFRDLCEACGHELHSCAHCSFYKPGAYRDCAETVPDEVRDKDRMNFCEWFKPSATLPGAGAGGKKAAEAKDRFSGLFGG